MLFIAQMELELATQHFRIKVYAVKAVAVFVVKMNDYKGAEPDIYTVTLDD